MAPSSSSSSSCASAWEGPLRQQALQTTILPLSEQSHKGSSGRIAVIGGSAHYTGAPYYAAMASLQAGADLAFVLTAHEAAMPLKCYSPELMVLPVYSAHAMEEALESDDTTRQQRLVDEMVDTITQQLPRIHALVIGPGMGRSPLVWQAVRQVIQQARERHMPVVLDADALFLLSQDNASDVLFQGYNKVILTPNAMEYKRLFPHNDDDTDGDGKSKSTHKQAWQDVTVVRKQKHDHILVNGETLYICEEVGGLKRSGGIGDVLAGTLGTMAAWKSLLEDKTTTSKDSTTTTKDSTHQNNNTDDSSTSLALSSWAACCFVKRATALAFAQKKRAMTAPDVLSFLGPAMAEMIPDDLDDKS